MAEQQSGSTSSREERGLTRHRPGSPGSVLQRFANEVDRMFDDFGLARRWGNLWGESGSGIWAPDVDVIQRNNELTVRVDLPGLKRDEVSVEINDNAITIQGERKREHEEEREGFYRSERSYGTFRRVIPLPEGAITEQAKAKFRDGVLEITMPAPPASGGRRLEITEESGT
jgi:HSP20 family protein